MKGLVSMLALLMLGGLVVAQAPAKKQDPRELQRNAQRALQQNQSEVERLIELRMLHDLGLSQELDERERRCTENCRGLMGRAPRDPQRLPVHRYDELGIGSDDAQAEALVLHRAQKLAC